MPNFDAVSAARNWTAGLTGAGQKIQDGVNRVTQAPGQKAASQAQKYINNVTASVPKWQRKVAAVTLEQWRSAMIQKGVPRVASGAQASETKFQNALVPLFQFMSGLWQQVDGMDTSTPAARDAKMLAWVQGMRQYQGGP